MSDTEQSYQLQLSYEMVDKITVDNLTEMKKLLQDENAKLLISASSSENGLLPCQKADFEYNAVMITHMTEVLKHFSKP